MISVEFGKVSVRLREKILKRNLEIVVNIGGHNGIWFKMRGRRSMDWLSLAEPCRP